jgi:hypothetical protein
VADGDEEAVERQLGTGAGLGVFSTTASSLSSPLMPATLAFQRNLILGLALGAVLHDLAGAEFVAAVDDGDGVGEVGEEDGLFHGGVSPPTTAMSLPRKKKPSQVAQVETPRPMSAIRRRDRA